MYCGFDDSHRYRKQGKVLIHSLEDHVKGRDQRDIRNEAEQLACDAGTP
jgi:hypothetical protein